MRVPNIHVGPRVQSWRGLWVMLAAYRLPLLILTFATALSGGYNIFFGRLLRVGKEVDAANSFASGASSELQTPRYIFRYTTTRAFAVCALIVGNTLCVLMYWCLVRVIFTGAGYVPAEPWRHAPRFDAERRHQLQMTWSAQQRWIQEQSFAVQQRAAQALREQQEWWADRMRMLQQQRPHLHTSPAPGPVTPLGPPSTSAVTRGRMPAVSTGSILVGAPTLPQPFSVELATIGSHAASLTPALTATVAATTTAVSLSAGAADVAASPSSAEVRATESATPQEKSFTVSGAQFSPSFPSAAAVAAVSRSEASTPVSSSYSSPTSSASASGTSTLSVPLRGSAGAPVTRGVQSSGEAPSSARSFHPRPCTPAASVEPAANPHLVLEYEADGSLRFCGVCRQYKPDASHHCRACQRCVFDMDHHCLFLNNCIGRHNYKYFFLCSFYSTMCAAVNSTLLLTAYLCSPVCRDWGLGWWWLPAGMWTVGACVAYLWIQHVFLLLRGVSTLERMAEASAERFLISVSGSQHRRVVTSGGCRNDCRMAMGEFVCAIEALAKRLVESFGRHGKLCQRRKAASCSLTSDGGGDGDAGAPSALFSRANRRAQRIALLFGRPPLFLYHLLPLAPRGEYLLPLLKSGEEEV
ncbi:hypothetical protein LSCM1_06162 [Leishmania martiniquensis]|uniref:Palmitoyltransferase n=1 Tax=Leishmania martiniquensis TaxID=1580590 RepID=A0A836HC64_9TRYP|nr:hypothetical protein LSCM1_06162 [Leishmania martiniquensis]